MRIFALSFHADYACGRSGRCCNAGWPIPIEHAAHAQCRTALTEGRLRLETARGTSRLLARRDAGAGLAGWLRSDRRGRCVLYEPARAGASGACAAQRQLGVQALPLTCRVFPRVCVLEPRGACLTLSHVCPTAAASLARAEPSIDVVADPPALASAAAWLEGLDVRGAWPPLLRPGVLLDWDTHAAWEREAVRVLAHSEHTPERALDVLSARAERLRNWSPGAESLSQAFTACLSAEPDPGTTPDARDGPWELLTLALSSVPPAAHRHAHGALALENSARSQAALEERWLGPTWPAHQQPVRRYLAARAFASWVAHLGGGLRTRVRELRLVHALLRAQAARLARAAGRALDQALLLEAAGAADLVLLHLADRGRLAAGLARLEPRPAHTHARGRITRAGA